MTLKLFVKYAKKLVVALGAALAILAAALVDDVVTITEWIQVAIAFLGAAGVYKAENEEVK